MNRSVETLWFNGEFIKAQDLAWPLDDRALTLGDGLFETIAVSGSKPRHFDDHWQRLRNSAGELGFADPGGGKIVAQAIARLAAGREEPAGSARVLFSRGSGKRGLDIPTNARSNLLVRVFAKTTTKYPKMQLALSRVRRNASQPSSRHKTLSNLDMVLSRDLLEANARGNESLLLDTDGHLSCVGVGNLFWLEGGMLCTPSLSCAVLPGTTRARIVASAAQIGLTCQEGKYQPGALVRAEAVFISNALRGIAEVQRVDLGSNLVCTYDRGHPLIIRLRQLEAASG